MKLNGSELLTRFNHLWEQLLLVLAQRKPFLWVKSKTLWNQKRGNLSPTNTSSWTTTKENSWWQTEEELPHLKSELIPGYTVLLFLSFSVEMNKFVVFDQIFFLYSVTSVLFFESEQLSNMRSNKQNTNCQRNQKHNGRLELITQRKENELLREQTCQSYLKLS